MSVAEAEELGNPEDERCGAYYYQPVGQAEGDDGEESSAELDDEYLTDQDKTYGKEEAAAVSEMERRLSALEGAGIEHVPELHEHEHGEEYRELIRRKSSIGTDGDVSYLSERSQSGMLEVIEEDEQNGCEQQSDRYDVAPHRACDDERRAAARLVAHDALRRRQRRERHSCKSVHDEVYPQHLRDRKSVV